MPEIFDPLAEQPEGEAVESDEDQTICVDCRANQREYGTEYCYYCRRTCSSCMRAYDPRDNDYCTDCYAECPRCENTVRRSRMSPLGEEMVCGDCNDRFHECVQCGMIGDAYSRSVNSTSDTSNWICTDCGTYCEDCSRWHEDACVGRYGYRGVRGYGHTVPEMWLGGPLPRNERGQQIGYYLGFELEITATRGDDATLIHRWSEEHLGVNIFDTKRDGSVAGFEIAVQPMTPEYFEKVPWGSFFEMLNDNFGTETDVIRTDEPAEHGLHVHIGRVAFRTDFNVAAFTYLIGQSDHLQRIGRRAPTQYCGKVEKPVSAAIVSAQNTNTLQKRKISGRGVRAGRDAINLGNTSTIEIRAFKSTRKAQNLRDAVRSVYVAAEYIRHLTAGGGIAKARALHWSEYAKWVAANYPVAFPAIAGMALNSPDDDLKSLDLNKQPVNTVF
jgi:hypothetical protein